MKLSELPVRRGSDLEPGRRGIAGQGKENQILDPEQE